MKSNADRRRALPALKNHRAFAGLPIRAGRDVQKVHRFRNIPEKIIRLIFAALPAPPGFDACRPQRRLIVTVHRARTPRAVARGARTGTFAEWAEGDGFIWPLAVDKERITA